MSRMLSFPRASKPDDEADAVVLVAPWVGPNGEVVLIARDSQCRLLGEPMIVPHGADHIAAGEKMWQRVLRAESHLELVR